MLPSSPRPGALPSLKRTAVYGEAGAPPNRTVGYEEASIAPPTQQAGQPPVAATLVGAAPPPRPLPAPPVPPEVVLAQTALPEASVAMTAVPATSGFEATMLVDSAAPSLPSSPSYTPTIGLSDAGAARGPSSQPASVGSTHSPRSTVLPRVEVLSGQPRITHQDRLRYEEKKKLGEGGVGEVVMVQDNDIERTVAVKRLRPGLQGTSALARFVDEIRVVGSLEHPNIVPIHDVGLDEQGQFFFVMKYVNGETLEDIIEKLAAGNPEYHRNYPFERRIEIFLGILEALSYAHDKGIIHRDIKPANIMVGPYGEVVVMDWGLAKKMKTKEVIQAPASTDEVQASGRLLETRVGSLLGTPLYMSPEQARGQHDTLDQRSDIYSLSVMLHELLTLHHYLDGRTDLNQVLHGIANEEVDVTRGWDRSPHQPAVPADLSHFVRKGLHKDPAQRYATVHEMIGRLRARAEGHIPIECPVTFMVCSTNNVRRFVSQHPFAAMTTALLFSLVTLASMAYSAFSLLKA